MSRYTGFVGDVEGASYVGVGPLRWALTWALSDWGTRSARSAWEVIAHEVNAAQPAYDSGCAVPPAGHSEDHTPPVSPSELQLTRAIRVAVLLRPPEHWSAGDRYRFLSYSLAAGFALQSLRISPVAHQATLGP